MEQLVQTIVQHVNTHLLAKGYKLTRESDEACFAWIKGRGYGHPKKRYVLGYQSPPGGTNVPMHPLLEHGIAMNVVRSLASSEPRVVYMPEIWVEDDRFVVSWEAAECA